MKHNYVIILFVSIITLSIQGFNSNVNDLLIQITTTLDLFQKNLILHNEYRRFMDVDLFNTEQDFITISLGYNCEPGLNTRKYNIRAFAFPFDWCLTPYEAVYNFINSDFKDFFKLDHLVPSVKKNFTPKLEKFFKNINVTQVSEHTLWVLDKQSGMIFNHDFTNNDLATIRSNHEQQYIKYQRRIARFYTEMNSGKHIYFIRFNDISKNKAIKLLKLIENKFPETNFTLIVISNKPEFEQNWNIPRLKNFYSNGYDIWEKICLDIKSGNLK